MRRNVAFGLAAGTVSLASDGIYGLVVIHLLLKHLPSNEAGYCILLATAGSLLLVCQFGLGPTVARAVARARVGDTTTREDRLAGVLGGVRTALRGVLALVAVVGVVTYVAYLGPVADRSGVGAIAARWWIWYVLGVALNLWGMIRLFVANGFGVVGLDKALRALCTLLGLAGIAVALPRGGGAEAVSVVYFLQNVVFAVGSQWLTLRTTGVSLRGGLGDWSHVRKLASEGSRLMVINLMGFGVTNIGLVAVEWRFGSALVPPLSALMKLGALLSSISLLFPHMLYPFVAATWADGRVRKGRRLFLYGVGGTVGAFTLTAALVWSVADWAIPLWVGQENYLGPATLAAVLGFHFVLAAQGAHSMPSLAASGRAFLAESIVTTVGVAGAVFLLPIYLGVTGVPLGMLVGTLIPSAVIVIRTWLFFVKRQDREGGRPVSLSEVTDSP